MFAIRKQNKSLTKNRRQLILDFTEKDEPSKTDIRNLRRALSHDPRDSH